MSGRAVLVVPAKAGTHRAAAETIEAQQQRYGTPAVSSSHTVPAQRWTPAFAGVTNRGYRDPHPPQLRFSRPNVPR